MPSQNRELTGREKQRIKKLITSLCANYDKEYGCLPLNCDCPMFGICYTNSALCRYFRSAVLPTDAKLQAVFSSEPMPLTACRQCGKPFPADGKRMYCSQRCAEEARAGRPPHGYGNTGRRNNSRCNAFALGKPYGTRLSEGISAQAGCLSLMFAFSRINGYTKPEPIALYKNFMNFSTGGAYGKQ